MLTRGTLGEQARDGALIRRQASFVDGSGTRARPEPERRTFLDGIRTVADAQFGGRIERTYLTILRVARRPTIDVTER
ncbi:MAG: hypothetical protein FJW96_00400 [Actinobacteria bacterium]|nr:hypothetical protein [Actinomycetota bacterium]